MALKVQEEDSTSNDIERPMEDKISIKRLMWLILKSILVKMNRIIPHDISF
jgi:hypothetical protein